MIRRGPYYTYISMCAKVNNIYHTAKYFFDNFKDSLIVYSLSVLFAVTIR